MIDVYAEVTVLHININIVECKEILSNFLFLSYLYININIVECKGVFFTSINFAALI